MRLDACPLPPPAAAWCCRPAVWSRRVNRWPRRPGLAALRAGGSAVDAALAAAITLTVVEPTSNGIGSDAFAIVWDGEKLHGLNASGPAPRALSAEVLRAAGHTVFPERGWTSVSVPGAPDAWGMLHERFGRTPFESLFADARSDSPRTGFRSRR